ncbi:MAG: TetR/AcrR family transcriptional regulator [Halobacteriovoraceae bacterium]|nr:TetR/AcrR family transcriptional regulator [Halobacteriovoraceae bacterium]
MKIKEFSKILLEVRPELSEKQLWIFYGSLQILESFGINHLKLTEISKKTKLSKSHIRYYYTEIDQLLFDLFKTLALVGQKLAENQKQSESDLSLRLMGIVDGLIRWIYFFPGGPQLFLTVYNFSTFDDRFYELHNRVLKTGLDRIELFLYQSDRFSKLEVETKAITIHSLLIGAIFRMISNRESLKLEYYRKAIASGINSIVEAVQNKK